MIYGEAIQHIDSTLFHLINGRWTNPVFDHIFIPIRDKDFWIPLYIIIAGLLIYFYRKRSIWLILILIVNITVSDQLCSAVIKPLVGRERPCNDPAFKGSVDLRVDGCGGGKSFPSSHASNTFSFAMLLTLLFRKKLKWIFAVSFVWAFLISYAQVYVGVHYPFDAAGGAVIGMLIGSGIYFISKKTGLLKKADPSL